MVKLIREQYKFGDEKVLQMMSMVPRHKFAPRKYQEISYDDAPVNIGFGQTMSQPFTVARMTNLLIAKSEKLKAKSVLEIGTGSGYQAAILSYFFGEVYTIEIVPELSLTAGSRLARLGYKNVFVKAGSGEHGWIEHAPYDAILITAGVKEVPMDLFDQLKVGGVLVAPVGEGAETVMTRFRRGFSGQARYKKETFGTFYFVPFVGEGK